MFGFDDLNASLGGLCSLVLRLSVDGHEKCAIIGKRGVEKVVDRCDILFFLNHRCNTRTRMCVRACVPSDACALFSFFSASRFY